MGNPKDIVAENTRRNDSLFQPYDPISGIGSPIPRTEFKLSPSGGSIYLPNTMMQEPAIASMVKKGVRPSKYTEAIRIISAIRIRHDFEFWAFTMARIQDKETKQDIPFRLRKPQRKILEVLERMRADGAPIRLDLLKARQYGGSTLIQIYFAWIQSVLRTNWHSVIVTDVENQAKGIRAMYRRFVKSYPTTLSMIPFEGSSKNKMIAERGCVISIGSMQMPDSLRSTDNSMIHMSEVGLWRKTDGKSPEDLEQALLASVPDVADTVIVRESTAKGVGNYWHRQWTQNKSYQKVFVGWHEIELYWKKIEEPIDEFIGGLSENECALWALGATLEGINWYRHKLQSYNGDTWRMSSEYPSTAEDAFQSTGRRYYSPLVIAEARKLVCDPIAVGEITPTLSKGKQALKSIGFQKDPNGLLQVWSMPEAKKTHSNRYIVSVDIGGTSSKADYSTINVLDRIGMADGGAVDRAALWRGHIDQDLLAWMAVQIATFYQNALLVVEVNSLDKTEADDTDGIHYMTVLDEIIQYYPNIYARNDADKVNKGIPPKYGFHMNRATKPLVMDAKRAALRDGSYIEYSIDAINEADVMEIQDGGVISAVSGAHDDIEVPTATAIYVSNTIPAPAIIKPRTTIISKPSESTF